MGFCFIFYKRSVVITHLGDTVVCHRVSRSLLARLSATPGSWSGHSVKWQKVFLKPKPREDISSICRTAVHLSQVIIPTLTKALCLKASDGRREGARFLSPVESFYIDMTHLSQATVVICPLRNYILISEFECITIGVLDWFYLSYW